MKNFQPWSVSATQVLKELTTNKNGLSQEEATRRLERYGFNALPEKKGDSYPKLFFRQFMSPLIYILLVSAVIVTLLGEYADAGVIMLVVVTNALIGAYQEGKAQNMLASLSKFTETEATVIRGGREIIIPDKNIVPGDIIVLHDGEKVPADSRLIYSTGLLADESALTGESRSVKKNTKVVSADMPVTDQANMLFRGSLVVNGTAQAVVVSTGLETVVGKISQKLIGLEAEVPLQRNMRNFSKLVIVFVVLINVILISAGVFYGTDWVDIFLVAVAVSVSLIPEGLPVILTLVLATGVWRMGKRNALVKRLQAVEALGQAKVIAVDKTGTITKNELMVGEVYANNEIFKVSGDGYEPFGKITQNGKVLNSANHGCLMLAGRIASFCASAEAVYHKENNRWKLTGEPTEVALDVLAQKIGFIKKDLEQENPQVSEIPFNSDIKFHGTVHRTNKKGEKDRYFLTVVGAPEVVISKAKFIWTESGVKKITENDRQKFFKEVENMSHQGLRVLAFSYNDNSKKTHTPDTLPALTLVGLYGMSDIIRAEAKQAIFRAYEAGIKVLMITGDHEITARSIAKEVGIFKEGDLVVTGRVLQKMSPEELADKLDKITVFARVTPDDKLRIISEYKKRGDIIAMTGDGVNDALSLVAADLGVSMGRVGTEVAKDASDIVLLDDNFGSIISAVEEGRAIYDSTRKVVVYLLSSNVAEALVIVVAVLLGWPLPLLATQIIWLNMVTDSFLVIALAYDPKDPKILKRPQKTPSKYLIDKLMATRALFMGAVMMVGTLILFRMYLPGAEQAAGGLPDEAMVKVWTVTLTALTLFQWFNIWNSRSDTKSVFKTKFWDNKYLLLASVAVLLIHLAAVYVPFMQSFLHTTALSITDWLIIFAVSITIILAEELRKHFYKTSAQKHIHTGQKKGPVKWANSAKI